LNCHLHLQLALLADPLGSGSTFYKADAIPAQRGEERREKEREREREEIFQRQMHPILAVFSATRTSGFSGEGGALLLKCSRTCA
jgi:hypothetical protein